MTVFRGEKRETLVNGYNATQIPSSNFESRKPNLIDFLDQLQKLAKNFFGVALQSVIEQIIYAKMPPHLKKSINQAHLENDTYEKIVSHLQKHLELNRSEALDELQVDTVTQNATKQNPEKPQSTCHHCKKPSHYHKKWRLFNREKDQFEGNRNSGANNNNNSSNGQTNSHPSNKNANNTNTKNANK